MRTRSALHEYCSWNVISIANSCQYRGKIVLVFKTNFFVLSRSQRTFLSILLELCWPVISLPTTWIQKCFYSIKDSKLSINASTRSKFKWHYHDWVFFNEHSRFTRQQGKGESIYLTPLYHFHPLHKAPD